jgi:metal-dependent hydrolase (beta-lactamase superfamily II)
MGYFLLDAGTGISVISTGIQPMKAPHTTPFWCWAKKNVLIDTVKEHFGDELLANISRIIDPKLIDIVISNHTEMDHSGAIPKLMHRIGIDKPIYCSKMGAKKPGSPL